MTQQTTYESSINVVISYKCPLKCRHCFFHSDRYKATKMEPELLDQFLREVTGEVPKERGQSVTGARCDVCLATLANPDNVEILRRSFQQCDNWEKWGLAPPPDVEPT